MQKIAMASGAKLLAINFGKKAADALRTQVDTHVKEPHQWLDPPVVDGAFPDEALRRRAGEADVQPICCW